MELTVEELNKLLEKEFERGKNNKNFITNVPYQSLIKWYDINNEVSDACKSCPKNPMNGGDGICHCTLGQKWVTYNSTSNCKTDSSTSGDFINNTITGDIKNES